MVTTRLSEWWGMVKVWGVDRSGLYSTSGYSNTRQWRGSIRQHNSEHADAETNLTKRKRYWRTMSTLSYTIKTSQIRSKTNKLTKYNHEKCIFFLSSQYTIQHVGRGKYKHPRRWPHTFQQQVPSMSFSTDIRSYLSMDFQTIYPS